MKEEIKFLKKYVGTPSPSGFEMELGGQQVWIDYVKQFCDEIKIGSYGNAYAYYRNMDNYEDHAEGSVLRKKKGVKTVLLDAHGDEIGFFVFDITDSGFIKIGRIGGSDITIAPSSRVDIWGEKGKVSGVFGHPAIHVQKDFKAEIEKTFVDIGVSSRKEVEKKGIVIGTPITMVDGYMTLGDYHCGRSLDDKIGGFINSQILKKLYENKVKLPFELVVVNAVQEEVGLFGAKMAAEDIKPDVAIAIDVTHDTDSPAYNKEKQGSISAGKGVVLMSAPSIQKKLLKLIIDTAKENKIDYQITASGRGSGTNADSYAYPHGIPTALVKMGMRYMHTTVETVHKKDVQGAIDLLYAVLNTNEIYKDFKYE